MGILRFKYQRLFTNPVKRLRCLVGNPNRIRFLANKHLKIPFRPILEHKFPPMVIVETTNACNLSCVHCPRSLVVKDPGYKVGFMEMELYKKIIDEMSQYKYSILRPFGDGETLLHPKIVEMVRYAKKKGILNIWMNTNGTLLTESICKDLLMTGINQMEISIDAATKETYDKIRIGGNFDTVIKNTLQCISLKKELFPTVEIIVSFVESTINIHEKEDFIDFWKDKADVVTIRPFHQHTGLVKENMRARQYSHKTRYPCPLLWTRASITYTGDLKFCENDWYNKKIVGNVKEKSIRNIWNSAEYRKLRSLHVKKRFSEIPLCNNCIDYFYIEW